MTIHDLKTFWKIVIQKYYEEDNIDCTETLTYTSYESAQYDFRVFISNEFPENQSVEIFEVNESDDADYYSEFCVNSWVRE